MSTFIHLVIRELPHREINQYSCGTAVVVVELARLWNMYHIVKYAKGFGSDLKGLKFTEQLFL